MNYLYHLGICSFHDVVQGSKALMTLFKDISLLRYDTVFIDNLFFDYPGNPSN